MSIEKPDPVQVQLHIKAKVPHGISVSKKVLQQVIDRFVETGHVPKGFEIAGINWRNPDREDEELAVWKSAKSEKDIKRAQQTLRLRRLLRRTNSLLSKLRTTKGKRKK